MLQEIEIHSVLICIQRIQEYSCFLSTFRNLLAIARMASKEIAAMLDALMGRHRNAEPGATIHQPTWEDDGVCPYFLVEYCPHDLFTNTKSDLGPCENIHDDALKVAFSKAAMTPRKERIMDDFLRMGQRMLSDADTKIKRSKERLVQDYREQLAKNGVTPAQQEEIEMKIEVLTEKINKLVSEAEDAGEKGDVEEAQGIFKLSEQLKTERSELQDSLVLKGQLSSEGQFSTRRNMEVCETCGAQFVSDSQARIDDHLMGKVHIGFNRLRASVPELKETLNTAREALALERERKIAEEAQKNGEKMLEGKEGEGKRSRSRDRKSRDGKRSRSRDRKRSKSRDRKRSRSRDRKRSRSRDRKNRSRSRDRRRSRSRDRRDRRRSRSRSRDRKRSRDRRRSRSKSRDRNRRRSRS